MADFNKAITKLLKVEGGFAEVDVSVKVGAVNWGITERFLRSIGYPTGVRELSKTQAKEIYKKYFWDPLMLKRVKDQRLAETVFIFAVNAGITSAVKLLQRALVSIGKRVRVDGKMGPETAGSVNSLDSNTMDKLISTYKDLLLQYYHGLVMKNPQLYAKYLEGWKARLSIT